MTRFCSHTESKYAAGSFVQLVSVIGGKLRELLHRPMNILKLTCLTLIQLVKQAWSLPESIATFVKRRRRQKVWNEIESERTDRMRNPSKYLKK